MKPPYKWKTKSPCWKCSERHENCHSNCERYLSYREALEEERRLKYQLKRAGNEADDVLIKGKIRMIKRNGKR